MRTSDLWHLLSDANSPDKSANAKKWVFLTILGISIGAILVALGGVISAKVNHKCLLSLYSLGMIASLVALFIGGGLLIAADVTAGQALDNYCNNQTLEGLSRYFTPALRGLESLSIAEEKYMCSALCPCSQSLKEQGYPQSLVYTGLMTSFDQCLTKAGIEQPPPEAVSLLTKLENADSCSGLCLPSKFWATRDMDSLKPPQSGCKKAIRNKFTGVFGWLGVAMLITGGIMVAGMIGVCSKLCRVPSIDGRREVQADLGSSEEVVSVQKKVSDDVWSKDTYLDTAETPRGRFGRRL
ncbi:hypothetical protein FGO68_gene9653 [Halteria grandinella]|uniref:Tetraspanin n=1 Tax=Halteria grandinella TaxID=5974 RepID=A0A8J8NVS5_HALGN|nr:hypothetical protein FGO68_gene9653 [Halteria grandinella]